LENIPQVTDKIKENYEKEIQSLKSDFKKKEQKYFNQLEETKLSLSAYQMQLDIERDHFDVLITEEKALREKIEIEFKENKQKKVLLEEKLKACEDELKEKNKKDAETSCSSRNISVNENEQKVKKKSIFGARGGSLETNEESSEYVIQNEKPESSDNERDDDDKDLEDLVGSIRGDPSSKNPDLFIPKIKPMKSSEMDEYHEFNVSMIKAKKVNPMNESIIIFDNVNQQETLNASLSELLR
jgi:hypothetical protein